MNNLIFYDTETTGIHKDFSQIIQCGSIFTDINLNQKSEQNIGSAPLPWVIPQPKAMLTNKKINSFSSNISHYQMMKEIQNQWKEWCLDLPAIFITYNGHAFDEELIRRQFWCNLLEPYITNTNQNGRLDLMLMIHNIAPFFSEEISIPYFEDGPALSIKLEHLADEHGIDVSDAHDAISDCKFMIGLCRVIKEKIPEVFDSFLNISTKEGMKNLLYSNEFYNLLILGVPIGLLTTNILFINQYPDQASDKISGKNHLVVLLGKKASRWIYALNLVLALGSLYFIAENVLVGTKQMLFLYVLIPITMFYSYFLLSGLFKYYNSRKLIKYNIHTIYFHMLFSFIYMIILANF